MSQQTHPTIIYVGWGVAGQLADVTAKGCELFNQGRREFKAECEDFGDPAPYKEKTMTVAYWRDNNKAEIKTVAEHQTIQLSVSAAAAPKPAHSTVIFVGYGITDDVADVTQKARELADQGCYQMVANNDNFGDPHPCKAKMLTVIYWENGSRHIATAKEGKAVKIPITAPAGGAPIPKHILAPLNGRRKALLIGINYTGSSAALRGCINDVTRIKTFLTARGFPDTPETMLVLTDDQQGSKNPTMANMYAGFDWLVQGISPGDSLFMHYSGHGGSTKDTSGDEADGMDETIIPVDYQTAGQIIDDELYERIVKKIPVGCRLTVIFDSCHSGTALDLPYIYDNGNLMAPGTAMPVSKPSGGGGGFGGILQKVGGAVKGKGDKGSLINTFSTIGGGLLELAGSRIEKRNTPVTNGFYQVSTVDASNLPKLGDVIMFSGCMDAQTSMDVSSNGTAGGAMSSTFLEVMSKNQGSVTYHLLVSQIRDVMKGRYEQIVQLSTSNTLDMNQPFAI